ncbi:hypothetical protein CEXT_784591 [Caerostris extrusa]|uniref:Uncharacterized protein n=1 Tax=Caerostris extrusa TaxID=172846 RepID=A0AAV4R4T1_CAEEX|nr:hypothetical protein CEXT_784591 [Caerostris extrusa]
MNFLTLFVAAIVSLAGAHVDRDAKRSFLRSGLHGVYDKSKFTRLDRVCEECYQLFRESDVHTSCRYSRLHYSFHPTASRTTSSLSAWMPSFSKRPTQSELHGESTFYGRRR